MAKRNMQALSHDRLLEAVSYDAETGEFAWRIAPKYTRVRGDGIGTIAGNGRRYIFIDRRMYMGSRLAWFYVHKQWPSGNLVPDNGDLLDLRLSNWREETPADAARRVRGRPNSSGTRGVWWNKGRRKWEAGITVAYKRYPLGRFATKEEASAAYEAARQKMLGATSGDIEQAARLRDESAKRARCRALWRKTLQNSAGITGWTTLNAFIADVGESPWKDRFAIIAIDPTKAIGPGNWQWEETMHSRFDTRTAEGKAAYAKAYREAFPMRNKERALLDSFGVSLEQYQRMFVEQNGVCGSCCKPETEVFRGKTRWLAVDHCHTTGAIRGLLCGNCNRGVGCFLDTPELLKKAADYLERHAKKAGPESNVIPLKRS